MKRLSLVFLLALPFSGCETVPESGGSGSGSDLAAGRRLYFGRCAACHAPEPVADYTRAEWRDMVVHMRERAKLTPGEEAALLAFLMANSADS